MSTLPYSEFHWGTPAAPNGASGVGLAETIVRQVKQLENVQRICDLGCGNGYLTALLADLDYEVVGVDASESGIKIASACYTKPKFICALIDGTLPNDLGDEPFDLVISSDVIEHLYRPGDLVAAAASLLKPGGQLLLGTPYHGYLKNLVLSVTGKMDQHFDVLDDGGHIKFFSVKTLSRLIVSHGFSDLSFSYYGRAPWLWKNMLCYARRVAE